MVEFVVRKSDNLSEYLSPEITSCSCTHAGRHEPDQNAGCHPQKCKAYHLRPRGQQVTVLQFICIHVQPCVCILNVHFGSLVYHSRRHVGKFILYLLRHLRTLLLRNHSKHFKHIGFIYLFQLGVNLFFYLLLHLFLLLLQFRIHCDSRLLLIRHLGRGLIHLLLCLLLNHRLHLIFHGDFHLVSHIVSGFKAGHKHHWAAKDRRQFLHLRFLLFYSTLQDIHRTVIVIPCVLFLQLISCFHCIRIFAAHKKQKLIHIIRRNCFRYRFVNTALLNPDIYNVRSISRQRQVAVRLYDEDCQNRYNGFPVHPHILK